jgi:hypothetical protein
VILFGMRTRASNSGAQALMCPKCGTSQLHRVIRRKRIFTLFFIPVIPLGSTYSAICANCGNRQHIGAGDVHPLPAPTTSTCPKCNSTVMDTDAFCKRCGADIQAQVTSNDPPTNALDPGQSTE